MLKEYVPFNEDDKSMQAETIQFVMDHEDCFARTLAIGHVTASGWVVSPDRSQVLLMHHRKLDRWFQPGGHCDGDADTQRVARKEVEEETGVADLKLLSTGIFDVDIHLIPDNKKESAHLHYDIRYLFEGNSEQPLQINIESKDLKWINLSDVSLFNDSESIMRMVNKTQI